MYDMKRLKTWGVAALVLSSVALLSCGGGNQGFGNNSDCDYLILPGFRSGGSFSFTTNRQCPKNYKADFDVRVDFIAPGTGAGSLQDPNVRSSFIVTHYDVTYRNLSRNGAATPGVDVPYSIRVPVGCAPLPPPSLCSLTNWPILQAGQKEQAPLNDSRFYNQGGTELEATLTFWGHPSVDSSKQCFGTFTTNFTIFDSARPADPAQLTAFLTSCN